MNTTQDPAGTLLSPPPCSLSSLLDSVVLGDNCETLAAMPAECIDLVVTSPPYDDLRTYGGHSWDFERLAGELTRVLKHGGVIVWVVGDATVNGSETLTSMRQAIHFKDVCGLNVHDTMIYRKHSGGANGSNYAYLGGWEYMFVISKGRPKSVNLIKDRANAVAPRVKVESAGRREVNGETKGRRLIKREEHGRRWNVWDYYVGGGQSDHPAIFPESLASDHIQSWSNPGDVVLDPFAGSGTTLKAAKELGRRFVGIEINPEYVDICHSRLAQEVLNLFPENA